MTLYIHCPSFSTYFGPRKLAALVIFLDRHLPLGFSQLKFSVEYLKLEAARGRKDGLVTLGLLHPLTEESFCI